MPSRKGLLISEDARIEENRFEETKVRAISIQGALFVFLRYFSLLLSIYLSARKKEIEICIKKKIPRILSAVVYFIADDLSNGLTEASRNIIMERIINGKELFI